jgi:nucleotide-binding universal stress UspA family protein
MKIGWSEANMFKHILIATDGSDFAQKAVVQGIELASQLNAKVSVLTVTEPWWSGGAGSVPSQAVIKAYEKSAAEDAARIASVVSDVAAAKKVACSAMHIKGRHPVDGIIEGAKESGCDLIVMASRGRSAVERFLLGSVATGVLIQSTIPVLICR